MCKQTHPYFCLKLIAFAVFIYRIKKELIKIFIMLDFSFLKST